MSEQYATPHPAGLRRSPRTLLASALALPVLLAGCLGDHTPTPLNAKPLRVGTVRSTHYDGTTDDLLTAGLGKSGLASPVAPSLSAVPTAAELRRLAIWTNYRAIVDMTAGGGYGQFYGPNVDINGVAGTGEGRIAGTELLAYADDGSGQQNVVLMVQIPDSFSPAAPCIITATSSGSRGVYGGIAVAEWGLKHGCAVAYNDKGTGAAPHELTGDTVALIDGTRSAAKTAGTAAHFNAGLTDAERGSFLATHPNRLAFKHAHSGQNPEKDWGRNTLQAIEFAFWAVNERFGDALPDGTHLRSLDGRNTIVIASSLSNGGGAAIAAAEADTEGLIGGVAVSEPTIEMPANPGISVSRGGVAVATVSKPLIDFTTQANLLQACASQSAQVADAPGKALVVAPWAANRCTALKGAGVLTATTPAAQADEALALLRSYGWEAESAPLHASLAALEVAPAVAVTYVNALSRARVSDSLCGFGFAPATAGGVPTTVAAAALAGMAGTGNGVPPSAGVQLINEQSVGGPLRAMFSVSAGTGLQDMDFDGAWCLRQRVVGSDAPARTLQAGLDQLRRTGNLHGKPVLIVHGRDDALMPVNHTSRPYLALNRGVEGDKSRLSYLEVLHAQHFDSFIGLPTVLPGYDSRYVPLHLYLNRALDAMYAHLKTGAALPPSQVVRTVPRGGTPGAAPALRAANVPAWSTTPAAADQIAVTATTVAVPD